MRKNIIFFARSSLKKNQLLYNFHHFVKDVPLKEHNVNIIWYGDKKYSIIRRLKLLNAYLLLIKLVFKPDVALFMDEKSSLGLAPKARKILKTKTVNFSHALVSYHSFYKEIDFDYYFVYGGKCESADKRFGVNFNKTEVVPIGPFYSASRLLLRGVNTEDSLKIFLASQRDYFFRVCITSQWLSSSASEKELYKQYKEIADYIKSSPDIIFYVKPHPLEKDDGSPIIDCYKLNNVVALSKESSVGDLFGIIDVNVTSYSNSALDFALLGVPTVFISSASDLSIKYGIAPSGYSLFANDVGELDKIIRGKESSKLNAKDILRHNADGVGFESIENFRREINKILFPEVPCKGGSLYQ
ncbi:CDP-glycerol glycerophosphotransferase family protein [Halomonas alimentaria]|uniref:CDP-glycerol glycerophosphotransferase family protein n=1 Tax=Halomonas alimentaria TaxID=147248 RepID=UPI0024922BDC|nr:CDP-glycerol glycerophosphotransferase family protein [Halomonas alimentaria]